MSNSFYSKCALLQFGGKKGAVGGKLTSFSIPAFLPCPYSLFTDTGPIMLGGQQNTMGLLEQSVEDQLGEVWLQYD